MTNFLFLLGDDIFLSLASRLVLPVAVMCHSIPFSRKTPRVVKRETNVQTIPFNSIAGI